MRYQSWQSKVFAVVVITALLGACAAMRSKQNTAEKKDRGIKFNHSLHTSEPLLLACADCHDPSSGEPAMPDHDVCSLCHEVKMEELDIENCAICHNNEDILVTPYEKILNDEVIFSHEPHVVAEVACTACHENPDERVIRTDNLMAACMECHATRTSEIDLNACEVCHKELREDVAPKFRGDVRIAHDAPEVWDRIHGSEARIDEQFCYICHNDAEAFCADCHQKNPPQNHTLSWRRSTHGLEASWDRDRCSVCHEEDSCVKCHENTKPVSHRGGFARGQQAHCVQCHLSEQEVGCTVCHEQIEHATARRSPHAFGVYPPNCARCHPGGLPDQAPHFTNSTTRCIECHR